MSKKITLEPFSIAGVLSYCPECGATGDYKLLEERVKAVVRAWVRLPKPESIDGPSLTSLEMAIRDLEKAVGMQAKQR